jgi:hypothetical protein
LIENARLYEESRRRVEELEHLRALGEDLARAESVDEVAPAVTARARELLRAESAQLYLIAPQTEELRLRATTSPGARQTISLAGLGPELATSGRHATVAVPLVAGDELLGLLSAVGTSPHTTLSGKRLCWRRSRSSFADEGTSARPRKRFMYTRTRCVSGCVASWKSLASTFAETIG